jgi:hypothetical protein
MRNISRTMLAGAAVFMPLTMIASSPATAAAADTFVIQGSGTISPGLTTTPTNQSISFTGTATVVGTHGTPGTYSCSFSGTSSIPETTANGAGTVSGSCGPIAFSSCTYVRAGVNVAVNCTEGTRTATAKCVFNPGNTNPTTRYTLICTGTYTEA